jgi:hypothetical protein
MIHKFWQFIAYKANNFELWIAVHAQYLIWIKHSDDQTQLPYELWISFKLHYKRETIESWIVNCALYL